MTNRIKIAIAGTIGLVVGAGVGSLVTRAVIYKGFEELESEEVYTAAKYLEIKRGTPEGEKLEEEETEVHHLTRKYIPDDVRIRRWDDDEDARLPDDVEPYDDEEEMETMRTEQEQDLYDRRNELKTRDVHQIVDDDFDDVEPCDEEIFSDADVLWYRGNCVYVDDDDEQITTPENWFGFDACGLLSNTDIAEGEEVCVRNNRMEVIFHILVVDDMWVPPEQRPLEGDDTPDSDWGTIPPRERMRRMNAYKENLMMNAVTEEDDDE